MSVDERSVDVDVDLEANAAEIVEVRKTSVEDLFIDGELRLWEDDAGWSGYLIEDGAFYHVNTHHAEDSWLQKVRVGEQAVVDAVQRRIEDPRVGGEGTFVRGATPP